ncbi:hypothetical protein CDES_00215 [Corynebacterium deserti GIMN1.010]|uniref:DUF2848 domain-containing protein n=1 Tax=Corynebacterium deserti GIMN1.010 TaxID=931089 RepID=A0A0M3Q8U0_9CORY|nr:DUF2848 domain-containing protein [Corynebacterium deserti]ALC04529.1 hypothetical protein CDES_00215 [Corynebacterium deserti GIMN1.010]
MSNNAGFNVLTFELPDGSTSTVTVKRLLNAGYAGKNQEEVRAHIDELAELGVPAPTTTPALYPVSPYLAQQTSQVQVQHSETSGESEWAIIIDDNGNELLTVASDHTDRKLETLGVAWSKNASPDVLSNKAWPLSEIKNRFDNIILRGWVGQNRDLIQEAPMTALLEPTYWLNVLEERGERIPGTILLSGTITMKTGPNQFADAWGVSLEDPEFGTISAEYQVEKMSQPIG